MSAVSCMDLTPTDQGHRPLKCRLSVAAESVIAATDSSGKLMSTIAFCSEFPRQESVFEGVVRMN